MISLKNVIGSIDEDAYKVIGTGGNLRHAGNFSDNNPYLSQLRAATNNKDRDALYERAVEWEADYASRQIQLEENRAILEEQREYDSPLAQIQRQREAGINPDIAGAGGSSAGGSGSAQLTNPAMADQTAQSKFSNAYDNASEVFNGINTTANFVSSLAGGISSVVDSFAKIKTLPSEVKLNEANAGLAEANANEVNQLLDGKKKSLDLGNVSRYMSNISGISKLLNVGFSDEEGTSMAKTMGIAEAEIPNYISTIRKVHEKPEILAEFENNQVEARKAKARNLTYTQKTLDDMESLRQKSEIVGLQLGYASTALQEKVAAALLRDDSYISTAISTEKNANKYANVSQELLLEQAMYDAEQWGNLMDTKIEMVRQADLQLKSLEKRLSEGGWTDAEIYAYNTSLAEYESLRNLTSQEFSNMQSFMIKIHKNVYDSASLLDEDGNVRNIDYVASLENFSNVIYNDIYTQKLSTSEIVRGWIGTSAGAVRDMSLAVGGGVAGYQNVRAMMPRPKLKLP